MLGEIPGALTAYYKLENANDSSGRGINLTTSGTVNFVKAKLSNGADFGSTGTANGLYYGSNPFLTSTPDEVYFSFWFKLNSTANTTRTHNFFVATSSTSGTTGMLYSCTYSISGGSMTINFVNGTSFSITTPTDWTFLQARRTLSGNVTSVSAFDKQMVQLAISSTTAGTIPSNTNNPTVFLTIGNARNLSQSAYAIIDQFVIDESIYVGTGSGPTSNRVKYRTQLIGKLVA